MMDNIAIRVQNLTKVYHIYDKPSDRLKEALHPKRKSYHHDFYALRDVSFEIKKGETVGIIGRNGAGKSTLLKIITGVLTQTSGDVTVNGKIASLLELGAGFNPEMTGIENIYLNGTIMGFTKKEMDAKVDAIIEFADIGEFIYQPVKMYSSGMFARLAFAVAINVEPDVLIVDEALSVGDVFFQQKCIKHMQKIQQKTTTLYVSHDLPSVSALVDRIFLMNNGTIMLYDSVDDGMIQYSKQIHKMYESSSIEDEEIISYQKYPKSENNFFSVSEEDISGKKDVLITHVALLDKDKKNLNHVESNQDIEIHLLLSSKESLANLFFGYLIEDRVANKVCGETTLELNKMFHSDRGGKYHVVYSIKWPRLMPGEYTLTLGIGEGVSISNQIVQCWAHNVLKVNALNSETVHCMFNHSIDNFSFYKKDFGE